MSWAPARVDAPATSRTRYSSDARVATETFCSGCAEATPGTASAAPAARVTAAARTVRRSGERRREERIWGAFPWTPPGHREPAIERKGKLWAQRRRSYVVCGAPNPSSDGFAVTGGR